MDYIDYHLPAGTCLDGRYTIKRVIGEGGFGITYEAVNNALGSRVAIKEFYYREFVTRDSSVTTQISFSSPDRQHVYRQARERFLREARIVSDFNDAPGIISVSDYFEANDTAYIVMKYLDGITLQQYLNEHGPFPAETICLQMLPMLRSLEKIHNSGIIHRDISPDNIMVLSDGSLCLMDFGAARTYLRDTDKSSAIITKNGYTPCEQYDNASPQGPWNDIYALSAVLYTCITGNVPESSLQRLLLDTLKLPSALGITVPAGIEAILQKGLSLQPEKRFQTLGEYIQELEKCLPREDEGALKKRRHKRIAAIVSGVAVFLAVLFALFYRTHTEYFKFYGQETAHFLLYPKDDMPAAEYYAAVEAIENRLKTLTDNRYMMEEKGGYLRCVVPLDDCGDMNLMTFIRTYISRPAKPYLDDKELSEGEIAEPELTKDENGTRISFSLHTANEKQLRTDITEGIHHYFQLDKTMANCFYRELLLDENGRFCFYVPDEANLAQLMLQNISAKPLSDALYIQYEPVAAWEDSRTSLISGTFQVNPEDITEPFITLDLSTYTAPDRGTWYHVISDFKARLDRLEIPYAFGTDTHEEKHVLIRMAQEDYCDVLIHILLQRPSGITLSVGTDTIYPENGFSMDIETREDDTFRIWFSPASSYAAETLENMVNKYGASPTVYLRCGKLLFASGSVTQEASGSKICLDRFGFDENDISGDQLPLFQLVQSCLYDTSMPVSYTVFSSNLSGAAESPQEIQAGRFGWNPNENYEYRILEELNQKIPELVNARFSLTESDYKLIVTLPDTTEEMTEMQQKELLRNILLICTSEEGRIFTIQLEKLQKNNPNWVDWRCYLFYSTANQAYDWYIQAFTEEDETVCRKLREDLQNDSALKNRLHLSEN